MCLGVPYRMNLTGREQFRSWLTVRELANLGRDAAAVAHCISDHTGSVILDTGFGRRLLVESDGEPLPRIC